MGVGQHQFCEILRILAINCPPAISQAGGLRYGFVSSKIAAQKTL
jgi:hypothetical protein